MFTELLLIAGAGLAKAFFEDRLREYGCDRKVL